MASLPPTKELNTELLSLIKKSTSNNSKSHTLARNKPTTSPPRRSPTKYKSSSSSPYTSSPISTSKSSTSRNPLVTLCIIGGIVVLILYLIVFIEIDGMNIYNLLTHKSELNDYNLFKPDHSQILQLELEQPVLTDTDLHHHEHQLFDAQHASFSSDGYFEMFDYIHQTAFNELSPQLQTRHLQELFRYQFTQNIHERQKKGIQQQPGQKELLTIMNEIYSKHASGINFVQIGACDGDWHESNDPIQGFILQHANWHGVMLEPVPYLFEKLTQNIAKSIKDWQDRIVPINAALSDHDGYQTFYVVNSHFGEEMPDETHALKHQIGSFNKGHIVKHLKVKKERQQLSQDLDYYIDAINVTTLSARSVVQRYRESEKIERDGSIDVLTIDAEGYDYVVLRGFLANTTIRPLMVIYENLHLTPQDKTAGIELLHSYGYVDVEDYWNTIGIRSANL